MDFSQSRCPECGKKPAFSKTNIKGRVWQCWRSLKNVVVTEDLELWTCGECGNYAIGAGDAIRIDEAIEASARKAGLLRDVNKSVWGIRCNLCQEFVWSRSTHDFRECPAPCKNAWVDGGQQSGGRYGQKNSDERPQELTMDIVVTECVAQGQSEATE